MEPETIDMQRMQRRVAAQNQLEPPVGHHRNFQYPFPTQPHEYMQLQNKPSGARIEELQQAWVENENFRPDVESDTSAVGLCPRHSITRASTSSHGRCCLNGLRRGVAWQNRFNTVFRGAREGGTLFDQSLEHYESVFAVPEELAMEEEFDRFVKELESWRSKVVVDDLCFHSTFVSRKKPGQIDKHQLMLHGPRKCAPASPRLREASVPLVVALTLISCLVFDFAGKRAFPAAPSLNPQYRASISRCRGKVRGSGKTFARSRPP
jgi:hypothetical protein